MDKKYLTIGLLTKTASALAIGLLSATYCLASTSTATTTKSTTPTAAHTQTTSTPHKKTSSTSTTAHKSTHKHHAKASAHNSSKKTHSNSNNAFTTSTDVDNHISLALEDTQGGLNNVANQELRNMSSSSSTDSLNSLSTNSALSTENDPALNKPGFGLSSSAKQSLVQLADRTVQTLRHTMYKLGGTHFDSSKGVYEIDCSGYVDNLLHQANPQAYSSLSEWSKTYRPTSKDYYDFFNRLPSTNWGYWHKIGGVHELQPGDILVFRYKNSKSRRVGGHVMVVMDKPIPDRSAPNVFWVNVADSAASGHTNDTRPAHTSGVGIGALLLKVNPGTNEPNAYAWRAGAAWKHDMNFVMAEPVNKANDKSLS